MAQTDKLGLVRRGHPPQRGRVPAARRQCVGSRVQRRGGPKGCGPLCAGRAEGGRRESDGGAGRRARRQRPVHLARRFRRADRPQIAQPPPARKPRRRGRVRPRSIPTAPTVFAGRRDDPRPRRLGARPADQRPARPVRRGVGRPIRGRDPPAARCRLDTGRADGGRARGVRFLFLGASGRRPAPLARRAPGQELRRTGLAPRAGRRRPLERDDGRAGRGRRAGAPRPRAGAT